MKFLPSVFKSINPNNIPGHFLIPLSTSPLLRLQMPYKALSMTTSITPSSGVIDFSPSSILHSTNSFRVSDLSVAHQRTHTRCSRHDGKGSRQGAGAEGSRGINTRRGRIGAVRPTFTRWSYPAKGSATAGPSFSSSHIQTHTQTYPNVSSLSHRGGVSENHQHSSNPGNHRPGVRSEENPFLF